ncbi:outer membrane beta-barrel protein [Bradyrhizobium sp. Ash2021]|uniref:outer membrane protein n=1 Tax=Bradyrhizobium sp. Ash2021 TaxID=2954771 RepID=UPI002814C457|nr:outer membrane beta-barrel protein [Bradyrhizobium sp. Ash2021]WMT72149.1 outer membrane beta-barrel protein [Bradyrhizobium sp. Ash2021]
MKTFLLGTVALVALGATVPALAADLDPRIHTKAPAYAAPIYNWTGFYFGGHIGGAFSGNNDFNGLVSSDNNNVQFLGGVQVGADYQFAPNWVFGIEGQYSWLASNNSSAIFPGGFAFTNDQRAIASVTGRIGYTWGPALLYAKGGYAYADNRETLASAGVPVGFALDRDHRNGFTVGAGLEYMLAQNWSAKVEYQFYDFDSSRFTTPVALVPFGSFRNEEHTVKAGLNYRFNWDGPLVAKY